MSRASFAGPRPIPRHLGMDWLRIGAFHLLILYHIGMYFVPWDWHVKIATPIDWVTVPMMAINPWRLPLLFAVSGYASAALLARSPSLIGFLWQRIKRLALPLLFGMLVVTPVQPWIQLTTQRHYRHPFDYFLVHDYFRFGTLGGMLLPAWQHLWFVLYLLVYTLALGLLLALPRRALDGIVRGAEWPLRGFGVILTPILLSIPVRLLLLPEAEDNHDFFGDWIAHSRFLPIFLFGWLLGRSEDLWPAVRRWWPAALVLAVAAGIAAAWFEWHYPTFLPMPDRAPYRTIRIVESWAAVIALIGVADRMLDRDAPARTMLAEAVFPFYIIHQTIIILVGWWLLGTATSPLVRLVVLVTATLAGCWIFYLAGREVRWLRPLIGLTTRRKAEGA